MATFDHGPVPRLGPTAQLVLGGVAVGGSLLALLTHGPVPPLWASIALAAGVTAVGRGARRVTVTRLHPKPWWRPLAEEIAPQEALRGGVLVLSMLMVLAPLSSLTGLPWQIVPLGLVAGLLATGTGAWVRTQRARVAEGTAPAGSRAMPTPGALWARAIASVGTVALLLGLLASHVGSASLATALWTVVAVVASLAGVAAARVRFLPDP